MTDIGVVDIKFARCVQAVQFSSRFYCIRLMSGLFDLYETI